MILLDTNVISEAMRPTPDERVINWLNRNQTTTMYMSTITIAEVEYGLEILPTGRRRFDLEGRFRQFVATGFGQRLVAFDTKAAHEYGKLMAHRRSIGRPMASLDGQIASIARAGGFTLATRNTTHFEECGLQLINPFSASVQT